MNVVPTVTDLAQLRDCRTCRHNTYWDVGQPEWVSCMHPVTIRKMVIPEPGDPAFVGWRTADMHVRDISNVSNCPTWEAP